MLTARIVIIHHRITFLDVLSNILHIHLAKLLVLGSKSVFTPGESLIHFSLIQAIIQCTSFGVGAAHFHIAISKESQDFTAIHHVCKDEWTKQAGTEQHCQTQKVNSEMECNFTVLPLLCS